jgi:hypothetical protein
MLAIHTAAAAGRDRTDPIFAAIDRANATWAALDQICIEQGELEKLLPQEKRRTENCSSRLKIERGDDPRWIANQRQWRATSDAYDKRLKDLTRVRPTSVAGVAALLRYLEAYTAQNAFELIDELLANAAGALEALG